MINERMLQLGSERSEIRELFEYGRKRKQEIGEDNVYDFSLGNPSVPCPDAVSEALLRKIQDEEPTRLHGYTSAQGDPEVRASIADYITKTHGFNVSGEYIYMTAGAAAALSCALTALTGVGEEVILIAPYFPEYKVFVESTGASIKVVKCFEDSFLPDINAITDAISEKTSAIIVNSPNNPSGAVIPEQTLIMLSEILKSAEEKYGKTIYLIADEPYRELVYDGASIPFIPNYYDDTVVCYSYSKSLSVPGERIGYCMVSPSANNANLLYNAICGAGRALGYVCAPSMLQKILPDCMGITSDIDVYDKNRQLLLSKLTEYGYKVTKPGGAFYLFMKSPIENAKEFSQIAKEYELLLVPSDSFGICGYVRISYCVKTEMIERALPAFYALAKRMKLTKGKI